MTLTLVAAPTAEPLSLQEAKLHLRVDDTADDALIGILLAAARQHVEDECRIALMPQTWRLTLDRFPCAADRHDGAVWSPAALRESPGGGVRANYQRIHLGRWPVTAVSSVKYVDTAGVLQTIASNAYQVDLTAFPPSISPVYGTDWPAARCQPAAVTVDFVAGYADAASVPSALKAAILLILGDLYANREAQIVGAVITENRTACALLAPYRLVEAV